MGQVQSTTDVSLQNQSLSAKTKITHNRIGDSNEVVSYGAHLRPDEKLPRFEFPAVEQRKLPRRVDLRRSTCSPYFPSFSQKNTGSCTGHAVVAAFMCAERFSTQRQSPHQQQHPTTASYVDPSVMFNYYFARQIDNPGAPVSDTGATMHASLQSSQLGMASDTVWRFDPAKINDRPPAAAQTSALHQRTVGWKKLVPSLKNIKTALAKGVPVMMSFQVLKDVDEWFVTADRQIKTGYLLTSGTFTSDQTVVGGHSVLLVGYDDDYLNQGAFLVRNSWGPSWGQNGHFWYQYDAALYPDISTEFFILTDVCYNGDNTVGTFCSSKQTCLQDKFFGAGVCDAIPPSAQPAKHNQSLFD